MLEGGDVRIRKRGVERIRWGHLWVYRSDIVDSRNAAAGGIVRVRDERGSVIAKAFYSSKSQIALRVVAKGDVPVDEAFLRGRIAAAANLRELIGIDPLLSRRVYSEGDLLPGLIVDRYKDRLVVQSLIQSADRLLPLFIEILSERYQPKSIVIRNDSRVRELEGLDLKQEVLGEPLPDSIVVDDDGKQMGVSLLGGQKTGSYLDQRDNHRAARRYARGESLDAFTYTGGFAIHISEQCDHVDAVDISGSALDLAKANGERNGLRNITFVEANAFDFLRQRFSEGARYDTIILDPPAFAKNKESLEGALRGYKEINNRAMRLLRSGGILITCSCSHHVNEALFAEMLAEAAHDAGCWLRVLERRIQSPDHPVLLAVPETLYLKCFILQVIY